jgi:hypothetical protein
MKAYRPGTAAVAIVTMLAMAVAGCQNTTDAEAPASTADKAAAASESTADKAAAGSASPEPTSAFEGTAGLPPADIVQAGRTALRQAKSFEAEGTLVGKHTTLAKDKSEEVKIKGVGKDYYESFAFKGSKVEVLLVGGHVYTRAESNFYEAIESAAPGDRRVWVHLGPPEKAFTGLFRRFDIDGLIKFTGTLSVDTSDIGADSHMVGVTDRFGAELYVAAFGTPYPMVVQAADKSALLLSTFDQPQTRTYVKKPPTEQISDFYEWETNLDH